MRAGRAGGRRVKAALRCVWENTRQKGSKWEIVLNFRAHTAAADANAPLYFAAITSPWVDWCGGSGLIFLNTLFELVDILRSKFKMV